MELSVPTLTAIVVVLAVLIFALLVITFRLQKRIRTIFKGETGSLEAVLAAHLKRTDRLEHEVKRHLEELGAIRKEFKKAYQKVHVERFDSFDETNRNQSFTLAALDGNNNGFVLTNLQLRDTARLYVKSVEQGKARVKLSEEEEMALEKTLRS